MAETGKEEQLLLNSRLKLCIYSKKIYLFLPCFPGANSRALAEANIVPLRNETNRFKCLVCAKDFSSRQSAITHFSEVHDRQNLQKTSCHVCGACFNNPRSRKNHLRTKHGIYMTMLKGHQQHLDKIRYPPS